MKYCMKCGNPLNDSAKFCSECGTPVSNNPSQRKIEFDGEIHKCPNCGEVLSAFTAVCPSCGCELRGRNASSSIHAFADNLLHVTSDAQKMNLIRSFPIPNTKEDILEFMFLASSNFDETYYATHLYEEDISDAWLSKIEQCYQKAKLVLSDNSDLATVDGIYSDVNNRIERAKMQQNRDRLTQENTILANKFKQGSLFKILIAAGIISALLMVLSFNGGKIFAGIIALLMMSLFIIAFLMGNGIIRTKIRDFHLVPLILAFVLLIPYFKLNSGRVSPTKNQDPITSSEDEAKVFVWPSSGLATYLPTPSSTTGEIHFNTDDEFWVSVAGYTTSDYEQYITDCKAAGFTVDGEKSPIIYEAYNEEGYYLSLLHTDFDEEMDIRISVPRATEELDWPVQGLALLIPKPDATHGEVTIDSHIQLYVYVGDTTKEKYKEYVNVCIEKGFNEDYNKGDTVYDAKNKKGDSLRVEYEGNNIMSISMYAHDE